MPDYNYRKVMNASRDKVECNLKFLGLLIMENKIKSQTTGVIEILKDCNVRTVMATGDNVLTAISVARQC
jgi:cation-transporting ATPase 13A3/4/5